MRINFLLVLIFVAAPCGAQELNNSAADLRDSDIICFCNAPGSTPQAIINLDNNGQILVAARNGTTRAQLKAAGISYTESQLQLLQDWELLDDHDGKLMTIIPILDRTQTEQLRGEVRTAVRASLPELRGSIAAFRQRLRDIGREKSSFTLLFSYVLDELTWDQLRVSGLLAERPPVSAAHPFWSGLTWAIEPPRKFAPGTNNFTGTSTVLSLNWSDAALPKLGPFISGKSFRELAEQVDKYGKINDPAVLKTFAPYAIADSDGNLTIPVIVRRPGDPINDAALKLAADVAHSVQAHLPLEAIQSRFGLHSRSDALIVAYHEFMWELLDQLAEEHAIERPVVLVAPEKSQPADVSNLLYVVRLK